MVTFDEKDDQIVWDRFLLLNTVKGPRSGDFVVFADGVTRRVSHVWPASSYDDGVARVQTSDGGSWYLGEGGCSFSGSLHPAVSERSLEFADVRKGLVWIFHHNDRRAGNAVSTEIDFRVYTCSENAT